MKKFFGTLLLGAALTAPLAAQGVSVRIYDRDRRDYHNWNDGEDRAYRRYLEDRHDTRKREFRRETRARQRDYWRWRHDHSDAVLFPR